MGRSQRGLLKSAGKLMLGVLASFAYATPQSLRIDGSIFDASGVPYTGSRDIRIDAFDASSGGSSIWSSSVSNASVSSGRFSVVIDASSLATLVATKASSDSVWFEIVYDTGAANGAMNSPAVVAPRIRAKGSLFALAAGHADAISGVTSTTAELNRLAGITSSVQNQLNTLASSLSGKEATLTKGDLTGAGSLSVSGGTGAIIGSGASISVATVTASLNGILTANDWVNFNSKASAASVTAKIERAGDTMTGGLGLDYSGANPSTVLTLDANRKVISSSATDTQLGYLTGLTTALAPQLNGLTADVQSQLNTRVPTSKIYGVSCDSGYYLSGFDMSGEKVCYTLPGSQTFTKVTSGNIHQCGLVSDGTVKCWGNAGNGQLGYGSTTPSYIPVDVRTAEGDKLSNIVDLAAGYLTTCALKSNGKVWCWGYNGYGNTGNGNTTTPQHAPVEVINVSSATQIGAAWYSHCARISDGTVKCWGYNGYYNLGTGNTTDASTPVQVVGITSAVMVSNGSFHTCVVLADSSVRCWGYNGYGELGDGTVTQRTSPTQVIGVGGVGYLTGVTYVSTSKSHNGYYGHSCAVKSDGTAYCWGHNAYGQLGNLSSNASYTPVQVVGMTNAVKIVATSPSTCARLSDGTAQCWGYGAAGHLGVGGTSNRWTATTVLSSSGSGTLSNVTDISMHDGASAGNYMSSAVAGGKIYSWGVNSNGQFGNNSTTDSGYPKGAHGP